MINNKNIDFLCVFLTAATLLLTACDEDLKSGRGLVLPEGNIEAGEQAFVRLHCNDCHVIAGRKDLRTHLEPLMRVALGGQTTHISTYGELVTSIINPTHRVSRHYKQEPYSKEGVSQMRNYNDVMTVTELSDLVAFLQQQYKLEPFAGPSYISH